MSTLDELKKICADLSNNPDNVNKYTDEQILELKKYVSPLGLTPNPNISWANLSVYNNSEKFYKRFLMTALVGFMYRLLEEYTSEEATTIAADYVKMVAKVSDSDMSSDDKIAEIAKLNAERDSITKSADRMCRDKIRRFLDKNLSFDPDRHVRKASISERSKSQLNAVDEIAVKLSPTELTNLRSQLTTDTVVRNATPEDIAGQVVCLRKIVADAIAHTSGDSHNALLKSYAELSEFNVSSVSDHDVPVVVPADTYHNYDRYIVNHEHAIREATYAIYPERPDIEFSVVLHSIADSEQDALAYVKQHSSEFNADIVTVRTGQITLLGPFKRNREAINYYTKNTELLELMAKQQEQDNKLAEDLVKKRVTVAKRKNIEEMGLDADGLSRYQSAFSTVQSLGAKKVLTREEVDKLHNARRVVEDAEVPNDAIQVDVFAPKTNADGDIELARSKLYTRSEVPDPEYRDKYKPF